jgi:hypothetical protein
MNHIECLQHGFSLGIHKKEGWLWNCLCNDGVVPDTQGALRERCFNAYRGQRIFIMDQQQLVPEGWDPRDSMNCLSQKAKGSGKFVSLQRVKNPVPSNVLPQSVLRFAYGVKKETFRRWIGDGPEFAPRIPHNKGKNVIIDDPKMAVTYFGPKLLFMKHEMAEFKELAIVKKHATLEQQNVQRAFLKQQFKVLLTDIMEVYKKASREKLAMHEFIEEVIVNTLNINCEQSFRTFEKVSTFVTCYVSTGITLLLQVLTPCVKHVSGWCSYKTIKMVAEPRIVRIIFEEKYKARTYRSKPNEAGKFFQESSH